MGAQDFCTGTISRRITGSTARHTKINGGRAQRYPALRPARPHAQKTRHCAPTPALPQPSPCSITRAAQTAPALAALPAPAPAPQHRLIPS